jgi:hypothetical protein
MPKKQKKAPKVDRVLALLAKGPATLAQIEKVVGTGKGRQYLDAARYLRKAKVVLVAPKTWALEGQSSR